MDMYLVAVVVSALAVGMTGQVLATRVKDFHLDQVKHQADDGHGKHQSTKNLWLALKPLNCLEDEKHCYHPDAKNGKQCSEDLCTVEAPTVP